MKQIQRKELKLLRRNFLSKEQASSVICNKVLSSSEFKKANIIMSYLPTPDEVDVNIINNAILNSGKTLLVPNCIDNSNMVAVKLYYTSELSSGMYGIKTVENGELMEENRIDLIIVPLVGFDNNGNRLGMGKGYYDRFMAKCNNAYKMGVAFNIQKVPQIATEPNDIKLDTIITE